MRDFPFVHDGDRLETAMRMLAHPPGTRGRRELRGARIVQQQEGAQLLA